MNKSKRSLLTAISSITLTLISGLFALIVTKFIILNYGSDFNGLISTAGQFIGMLLIIEGGFTIATIVALFKPMTVDDRGAINSILSATRSTFNKIGLSFFLIGTAVSVVFAVIVKSELSPFISFSVFVMIIISTSFNLVYSTKYKILLQAEQKEYILNSIQIVALLFSQSLILVAVFTQSHMLFVVFFTMLGAIVNSLIIVSYTKKTYSYLCFTADPDHESIKGTKDLFIQKLTGLIYTTLPVVFISITVGTAYASVYVVYNNVFRLLKSVIYTFINAPSIGFGKLIAEKDTNTVLKVFLQYEFIVSFVMFALLSTATVLIMPFINIYTRGITDANYYNWFVALFLIAITFFEIIHIPSGIIINFSGRFKIARNIQALAGVVLVSVMIIGNFFMGFFGILLAVLITAIILAVLEITYIHTIYFEKAFFSFFKIFAPNLVVMVAVSLLEIRFLPSISSYLTFFVSGMILVTLNAIILILVNLVVNKPIMLDVAETLRSTIAIKRKI